MLLIDADALSKLSHWDLLGELAGLIGVPINQTATLSSIRHRAAKSCRKPDGKLFRDALSAQRAVAYIEQLGTLPEPDGLLLARLQDIPAVDPGEAVLFGSLVREPAAILLTGDKRAIVGITNAAPEEVTQALNGRILIVEQVLHALLVAKGIDWLRDHVCPHRALDTAIGIVMGSACDAPSTVVEEGLISYIKDAQSNSGQLLRMIPPWNP